MFKPLAESIPSATNLPASRQPTLISKDAAEALAILVLGSYRAAEVSDPEVFIATTTAVISGFSEDIAKEALNPRTGLQTRLKWLPTVSEIREACEQAAGAKAARERREQLAEHRVLLDTPQGLRPGNSPEGQAATQEARDRAIAYWRREVRPQMVSAGREPRADRPPPGLTEAEERAWYEKKLEALKNLPPLGPLSEEIRQTRAGQPWVQQDAAE